MSTTVKTPKTAFVTGGSSGIGKALAKELYQQGFTVFAGARRLEQMDDLARLGIHTLRLDVTNDESVRQAFKEVSGLTGGKLDFLFNNAGASCTFPAMDLDVKDAEDCFAVNLFGVIRVTKIFLPLLIEAKGAVVQTGSLAGVIPFPFSSVYSASKAALHSYSDILRIEMRPFGVKVVTLKVGGVLSDIADTRPLPKDSLYLEIDDGVQARRTMAKNNKPMPTPVFAESIVRQVCLAKHPKEIIWEGRWSWVMWFVSIVVPRFILEFLLARRFSLDKLALLVAKQKRS